MQSITEKIGAPPALPSIRKETSLHNLSIKITVSTPMVGGGVEAGIVDTARPVRVPSIRGHLRWWWRMLNMNAPNKDTREAEIWGSTDKPGKVYADVNVNEQPKLRYCNDDFGFDRYGCENYALFASRQNGQDIARENFTFTLTLKYPQEYHDDVRLSLSAWLYFGGLGARTRRGCGSLSCSENPMTIAEVLRAAPHIILYRKKAADSLSAWSYVVRHYMDYRQNRKKEPGKRPGRSRWPEADSLRQITGRAEARHAKPITSPLPSFPRAALGLPIIFHFKDRNDPYDVTVLPNIKDSSRMASPVITKALYENGSWYSAVIILPHDDIVVIKLDGLNRNYDIHSTAISDFEEYISGKNFKKEVAR